MVGSPTPGMPCLRGQIASVERCAQFHEGQRPHAVQSALAGILTEPKEEPAARCLTSITEPSSRPYRIARPWIERQPCKPLRAAFNGSSPPAVRTFALGGDVTHPGIATSACAHAQGAWERTRTGSLS